MSRRRPTQNRNPKVVVGYVRVSTDEQALGPKAQVDSMVRWCKANECELAAVHEDVGISGAAALDKRPGLQHAFASVAEHNAGVLLVAKRDRLARDVMISAMVERLAAPSRSAH